MARPAAPDAEHHPALGYRRDDPPRAQALSANTTGGGGHRGRQRAALFHRPGERRAQGRIRQAGGRGNLCALLRRDAPAHLGAPARHARAAGALLQGSHGAQLHPGRGCRRRCPTRQRARAGAIRCPHPRGAHGWFGGGHHDGCPTGRRTQRRPAHRNPPGRRDQRRRHRCAAANVRLGATAALGGRPRGAPRRHAVPQSPANAVERIPERRHHRFGRHCRAVRPDHCAGDPESPAQAGRRSHRDAQRKARRAGRQPLGRACRPLRRTADDLRLRQLRHRPRHRPHHRPRQPPDARDVRLARGRDDRKIHRHPVSRRRDLPDHRKGRLRADLAWRTALPRAGMRPPRRHPHLGTHHRQRRRPERPRQGPGVGHRRHHPGTRNPGRDGAGAIPRRSRKRRQERLPGQHEPRDPHPPSTPSSGSPTC